MPRSIAVTCQVCLSVNDPVDVLAVQITHAAIPQLEPVRLCRLCTLAIMKAAIQSELIDPSEVFGADPDTIPPGMPLRQALHQGTAAASADSAAAPDAEHEAEGPLRGEFGGNGHPAGPMPGGKCVLDCGRPALDDDIYCGECRATLRE